MSEPVLTGQVGRGRLWTSYVLTGFAAVFLLWDAVIKVMVLQPVLDAFAQLGMPAAAAPGIGILELLCVAVALFPPTSVLGAVLLTGYLGGAIAIQVRAQAELFSLVFPLIIGAFMWGGLLLRDGQLRSLIPIRSRRP